MAAEALVHHQDRGAQFAHRSHGIFEIGFHRDHARSTMATGDGSQSKYFHT